MAELPEPLQHTAIAIYSALEKRSRGGDSLGVPMSQAVNPCDRATWYVLRWAAPPEYIDGQKQRRFDTGLREEGRLLDELAAAGVQVERLDPATGKQFRVSLADGWLRGKMDGRAVGVPEAPKTIHVVECKSHNDRSFKELVKKKLRDGKPEHFAQCQLYLLAQGLTRCLYLAVNKNTDELYAERIEYDAAFALAIEAKVSRLVATDRAPSRLYDDPKSKAAFACQWCPALAICHEGAFARRNCRTCLSAELLPGAVVRCALLGTERSYDEQQAGCASHLYLPDLVPATEQLDAGDRWVSYKLASGAEWRDGGVG